MTLVTAVIRDQVGNVFSNAVVEASYLSNIPSGIGTGPPLVSGSVFQTFAVTETDTFGNLSMNLTDLAVITPTGGSWFFNVLNNARTIGFSMNSFAITGASVDLTAAFAAASAPLFPAINLNAVGAITFTEQAAPAGAANKDVLWGDSTAHRLKVKNNNGAADTPALFSDNLGVFAATTSSQLAGVISDETGTGALVFATGAVIAPTSQGGLAIVYADQFANVQAAINALPAAGGCVDARSPNVNLTLGTIDPGSKQVTLLLGPLSYTCDHIVLQANFRILGSAATNVSGAGTLITSVGANSQPLIVNITSGFINVRTAEICDVTLIGAAGNTSQDGMRIDTTTNNTASVVDHLWLKHVNFSGFKGRSVYSKAPTSNNGSFNQFWKFDHVTSVRPSGALEALRITGESGQMDFYSCVFDGAAKGNGTNIYIGTESNADTAFPYSINFYSLTSQGANIDVQLSGFNQVGFFNSHHENSNIVYEVDSLHTLSRNGNVVFSQGYFANAGTNAGAGRILKVTTPNANGVILEKCTLTTAPDRLVESTNGAEVLTHDNTVPSNTAFANITTGIDFQTNPAATMNLGNYHTVMLQASATSMTTIVSQLGPGELITFFANGICQFATGGNITLAGSQSLLILYAGDSATFVNSDYSGSNVWKLVGTSSAVLNGATAVQLITQGANIGTTTAFAVPATPSRGYRIHIYEIVTRAATTSSTLPTVNIGWTDKNNSTAQTLAVTASAPTGNSLTTVNLGTFLVNALASTNITYSTTAFASVGATSMQYALLITVEPI